MAGSPTFERQFTIAEKTLPTDAEAARVKYERAKAEYEKTGRPAVSMELEGRNSSFLREFITKWLDELDALSNVYGAELSKQKLDEFVNTYLFDINRLFKNVPQQRKGIEDRIIELRDRFTKEAITKTPVVAQPQPVENSVRRIDINSWSQDQHPEQIKKLKTIGKTISVELPAHINDVVYLDEKLKLLHSEINAVERQLLDLQNGQYHQYENKVEITDFLRRAYLSPAKQVLESVQREWERVINATPDMIEAIRINNLDTSLLNTAQTVAEMANTNSATTSLQTLKSQPGLTEFQSGVFAATLRSLELKQEQLQQKDKQNQETDSKNAETLDWETHTQPFSNAIEKVLAEIDLDDIYPHSLALGAKHQAEIEIYEQTIKNTRTIIEKYLDISQYIHRPDVASKIERLVGKTGNEGRYGEAIKLLNEALRKAKMSRKEALEQKSPSTMAIDELIELGKEIYTDDSDLGKKVKNEIIRRNAEEKDKLRHEMNSIAVALPQAELAGDSQLKDWAADYNKAVLEFGEKTATVASMYEGLFLKPKPKGKLNTDEDIDNGVLDIDVRALDLWDYIVGRIKGSVMRDGIPDPVIKIVAGKYVDATGHYIPQNKDKKETDSAYQARLKEILDLDQDFSYPKLVEHATEKFNKQLELIFEDMDATKLSLLIRFYRVLGAKTTGYQPWLIRAATRSHGFSAKEQHPSDESKFLNPFALIIYNATRYANLKHARYMSRLLYVPQGLFSELIGQANSSKKEKAKELWHILELFRRAVWDGEIPSWMTEARKLFEKQGGQKPEINIDGTIFPLVPEMIVNITRIEQEKRDLIDEHASGAISDDEFIRRSREYVEKYEKRGYSLGEVGKIIDNNVLSAEEALGKFGQVKMLQEISTHNHVNLAAPAVDKMFTMFEKPLKTDMSSHEAVEVFQGWLRDIIGKAKLVPGDHQLLFVPFTCELITILCNTFEHRSNRRLVNKLFNELLRELQGAGGVPYYIKPQIYKALGGVRQAGVVGLPKEAPRYCTRYDNLQMTVQYRQALWQYQNEENTDFVTNIGKSIPFYSGSPNKFLDYSLISPYDETIKKEEDTTGKSVKQ